MTSVDQHLATRPDPELCYPGCPHSQSPRHVMEPILPCEAKSGDPWWCAVHDAKWDLVKRCTKAEAEAKAR